MSITSIARRVIPARVRKPLRRVVCRYVPPLRQKGKGYIRLKAFLDQAQWWDLERIEAWQLAKLQATVRHAYEQVPGYRALYSEAGVTPDDIVTLQDIRLLPTVDKEILRNNLEDFCARDMPSWRRWKVHTSGSSGVPLHFYHADTSDWIEDAFMDTGWERGGWQLGDTIAVLTTQFMGTKKRFWYHDRARRQLRLSIYQLDRNNVQAYVDKINVIHAQHLYSGASTLCLFASHVLNAGLVGSLRVKSILLGSEAIADWHKDRLREAFPGAKIHGWYGHSERSILAQWCETSDIYHVSPFYGRTEVLGADGQEVPRGESGELVGTSFWSQVTPFIRYRAMDRARRAGDVCSTCGRHGMMLESIEGRSRDMLIAADGSERALPPNIHDDVLCHVEQLQYYQDVPGRVTMRLLATPDYGDDDAARIRQEVGAYFGEGLALDLEVVTGMLRTESGKFLMLDQRIAR